MEGEISLSDFFELLAESQTLGELFFRVAENAPDRTAYTQFVERNGERILQAQSYRELAEQVRKLAQHLSDLGVGRGDRVAICSSTRPEWLIADLAILSLGAVSVSVYQTLNQDEMAFILADSGSAVLFAENIEQLEKTRRILDRPVTIPAVENRPRQTLRLSLKKVITFEHTPESDLSESLDSILATCSPLTYSVMGLRREDLASLVYTSGTTGVPKGVMQTHGNHLSNIFQATRTELFGLDGDIFLFLPLAHSFARLIGYIGFLSPALIRFPAITNRESSVTDIPSVLRDLKNAGAQVVPTVPRILEKMKVGVEGRAKQSSLSGRLIKAAIDNAELYRASGGKRGAFLHWLLTPIRKKIRRALFGDRFEHLISGGAKLPLSVCEFFLSLDIMVYQGYGLTETCVATNVNLRDRHKPGSVGPCLYGVEVKLAQDGEILFRGPNIAAGYWRRSQATSESWDREGFFHTGDLGELDEDGFLWVTGRKKELIVSSTGKKVVPGPIEEKLLASGLITQAILIGDERSYCTALLVPTASDVTREMIQTVVDEVNRSLSKHEEIRKFMLVSDEFTVENGLLTPTLKVRRTAVCAKYEQEIASMYDG